MRASDQMADRPTSTDAIPPHATPKSPMSKRFRSGVQGEWSETMQSMTPFRSPSHSSSRLLASRIGGQHLYAVPPLGTASAISVR